MHPRIRRALPILLLFAAPTLRAQSAADSARGERVARSLRAAVEVEGRTADRWPIAERMARYRVPGVSIAVADGGRIVWARGFGLREAGGGDPVDAATLFQAQSISKVIAATATLRLVDQGRLDLDADVNGYLTSWRVPENRFTAREKVTLRRILSHSAGLTVHGFRAYRTRPLPTVLQVLDGEPPAANAPVRVDTFPGAATRYSGGGTTVQQVVLADLTGRPFPALMDELVLRPLGMANSTFAQPLPAALQARAAGVHDGDGRLAAEWVVGPEMAAGGLWTTPTDLLRWAVAIDQARRGEPGSILSRAMAAQMLTPQSQGFGLGPALEGSGRAFRFSHGGSNVGFRAQLVYFPETGQGAAIMVNSDNGDLLIDEIQRAVAAEYGWPALAPMRVRAAALDDAALDALAGEYTLSLGAGDPRTLPARVARDRGRLAFTAAPLVEDDEVIALSPSELASPAWGYTLRFDLDPCGGATGFTLTYGSNVFTAVRTR